MNDTKSWAKNVLKQNIDITFILDRSGSMHSIADDAEGGMNSYIKDRQDEGSDTKFTFIKFDSEYEKVYDAIPVGQVGEIKLEPRGSTALLDTLGRAINETKIRIDDMPVKNRPKKVLFVVLTDGHENASREFSKQQIKDLIEERKKEDKWTFVFLGANQDAFSEATVVGVTRGNAINFSATPEGVSKAIKYASARTSSFSFNSNVSEDNFFEGNAHVDDVDQKAH